MSSFLRFSKFRPKNTPVDFSFQHLCHFDVVESALLVVEVVDSLCNGYHEKPRYIVVVLVVLREQVQLLLVLRAPVEPV